MPQGFEVEWPQGSRQYANARKTIIALVNQTPDPSPGAYDPHLTFNRYFRKGRYQRRPIPRVDILELFLPSPANQVTISAKKPEVITSTTLTVHIPEPVLGIDLSDNPKTGKAIEVRRMFYAGFARHVIAKGYDPEDVLQDIYVALTVRNGGKCPFDSRKASFAHYVHMVCRGTVSNYHRRYGRLRRNEQFGVTGHDGVVLDVAEADLASVAPEQENIYRFTSATGALTIRVVREARREGVCPKLAKKCVTFLLDGMRYKEMAAKMKVSTAKISEAVRLIRRVATEWRLEIMPEVQSPTYP
jgi:DNA-directed RNA polymerase specialized sigma24 family protein